jgi:fucose permease
VRRRAAIYLGFTATGVGAAVPGALLPLLLHWWRLGDARGGVLLFCFFLANTTGALLARGVMHRTVARGALLTTAGALWLGFAGRGWGFAAMAVYGLGLGVAMTATSLLVSRRFAESQRVEMMRLNLLWAAGASAAPWIVLGGRTLRIVGVVGAVRPLHALYAIAAFFVVWAVWMWFAEREPSEAHAAASAAQRAEDVAASSSDAAGAGRARWALLAIPFPLLVLTFCATGIDGATGGWLAAYAQRVQHVAVITVGAATAFWVGSLTSRALHSLRWVGRLSERAVMVSSTALVVLGLALLVAWPAGGIGVAAAFCAGFGAGPVYPLLLAMVLRRRETTGIFVLAGAGAATLPLLTGAASEWTHSLAAGLMVPLAAGVTMMAMSWTSAVRGGWRLGEER